ncbi:tetratricopeptide repeat protein [Colwellia sp. 4_MG-2023]|jgi:TPR repeat protein|uniref:tetratricopeptide repeat protein n=1 Tax=unclassified Colwellia TaxID=196834 RepID=UPI001C090AF3|nr:MULTISPECIES: tetratricopeptide repeat protein [unclassified Colwellia]MBU2924163.1 sel1 repeat family protein [Colwellia sp. C2M11]MDO6506196.1 tetratricopeptide repeat protein [Colwellia sp. 5_MG-2023]MDO6554744.1 tetratricopeptide repeat protein [Colwellia sp. 4_MG-2023]MDO6652053.1 tetratricopeptide repeat protein [Colwellia sp. 3_MG-2023]MDO6664829.1 tetratricopeptide repeat protein [Colwellia sp. 2_MG-2023]
MRVLLLFIFMCFLTPLAHGENLTAVQIYTDDQLLDLIKENKHLGQVVLDECQLVQDIEARAVISKMPSYQFLWGDMLAYGVCVKKDIELGLHFMRLAANQGLIEGLEQMGRYYHIGRFMQKDIDQAISFLKAAASMNNLAAQMRLAGIYNQGYGSPLDYPELYSQLHHAITDDKAVYKKITQLKKQLATKMPDKVVNAAKKADYTN